MAPKIESESSDVKRKMELECNEMRDRLQGGTQFNRHFFLPRI